AALGGAPRARTHRGSRALRQDRAGAMTRRRRAEEGGAAGKRALDAGVLQLDGMEQTVLPIPAFRFPSGAVAPAAGALVRGSRGIGTVGYHVIGHLPWLDAMLNAAMILTGMGPVDRMTTAAAKWFATIYAIFSGVAFLSSVGVFMAPVAHRLL